MIKFVVGLIFIFSSAFLFSQKYAFVTFSTEEGLPQSQVTSISQDDQGYLWVGTFGGLAKFNGDKFESYSSKDGLLNNRVTTIRIIDGKLWIGHDGGISFKVDDAFQYIAFQGNDRSRNVSDIIKFKDKIYVTSNGGGLFVLENNDLKSIDLGKIDYSRVRSAASSNGKLYLATRGGVLISENGEDFELEKELGSVSYSGVHARGNSLIFSTYTNGLTKVDVSTGKRIEFNEKVLKYSIFGCYIDQKGEVWLNSQNGIIRINLENEISFIDNQNGLPVNMISTFFEDVEQNMWVGSQGKGLFRFPGASFKYFDKSTGLPTDLFVTGFQSENGDLHLGSYDNGLIIKTKKGETKKIDIGNNTIWSSLHDVDNKDWYGTQRHLVAIDAGGNQTIYKGDDIPGTKVTALFRVDEHTMFVGGNEGVVKYEDGVFRKLGGVQSRFIGTVRGFEVIGDDMYCVTNLGIFKYEKEDFIMLNQTRQVAYSIEKDRENGLWYGAAEGLFCVRNGSIKKIELLDDPASNYINFINYKDDELYVGTNNGLFILTDIYGHEPHIKRFGLDAGVVDLETNLNSGFFDFKGNFWFGTALGLVCYHPKVEQQKASAPLVNLKSILLNYQSFNYLNYSEEVDRYGLPTKLILPYSKNNLIFELDGVSAVHHRGLRYQFYLEGLSDSWSPLSDVSTITFTSLPAGGYKLKMRAMDIDERLSKEIVLAFVIREAYYKTWWFIGLIILSIAMIVVLVFRLRLRRVREHGEKEKLIYKSKLLQLEQKSVNASMNRHFIFNALNSIQYFINTQDKISANKYLTNFAQLIRKNLDSASSEGNQVTLEEELERLKLYLSLEAMRFKDKFDYEVRVSDVDPASIDIPAMLLQPFIENSIIHGILPNEEKKGCIKLTVNVVDDCLNISIEDNGVGVNFSKSNKIYSPDNHKSQGMEITSKRIELIQKVSKNKISLQGPIEVLNNDGSIKGTYVLIKIPLNNLDD